MSKFALAIHTSSPDLGLAIAPLSGEPRLSVQTLGRDLSNSLHTHLVEFLKPQTWQDLAFIAVAIGPGGFTGTRIGVVLARTLAQQLDIPLFGISSLAAVTSGQTGTDSFAAPKVTALQMPAQRGELYTAIYRDNIALQSDTVMTSEQWVESLEKHSIDRRIEVGSEQGQYVEGVLSIALQRWQNGDRPHWSEVLPYYGQHPVILAK
jgi:tRNA threonylcarbamoyl adenosine modification protein YeaZ